MRMVRVTWLDAHRLNSEGWIEREEADAIMRAGIDHCRMITVGRVYAESDDLIAVCSTVDEGIVDAGWIAIPKKNIERVEELEPVSQTQ